jgi:cysteine sulfinate desulfinase/cysteine desulfurase-like protein
LDYNATTPIESSVIKSMVDSLEFNWQNPSSQTKKGKLAKQLINESRAQIAKMINASCPSDILFMSGGTEANNIVFYSALKQYESCRKRAEAAELKINKLPHIIISKIEHDSVKLIADYYKAENLAGMKHKTFTVNYMNNCNH